MVRETLQNLEDIELVIPAKKVYDALLESVGGNEIKEFNEQRFKEMKILLGFQNSLVNAFHEKKGYFKLVADYKGRVKYFEKLNKGKK